MPGRIPDIANSAAKVQLARVSHVYYSHPDIKEFERFAQDFGFVEESRTADRIFYRGYGRDPFSYVASKSTLSEKTFDGGAWVASTAEDFEKATRLPGAVTSDLTGFPRGGRRVTISAPGGSHIHVIYGQEERTPDVTASQATRENLGPYNTSFKKGRKGKNSASAIWPSANNETEGEFQRFHEGPALVHKLGHYGLISDQFDEDVAFYTSNFNLAPSDILHLENNPDLDVLAFFHIDLGPEYTDHHSFFIGRAKPDEVGRVHHASFEVEDFDTQLIGHDWLVKKGYRPIWGVGRHILGSQIFDYWSDTSGFTIEHYTDGDLVNQEHQVLRQEAGPKSLSIWGPSLPEEGI